MKKKRLILITLSLTLISMLVADTITIGSGASTTELFPTNKNNDYSYCQQIIPQSQINKAGNIYKISLFYSSGNFSNSKDWVIYMGHTTKSSFSSSTDWIGQASLTQVFAGDVTNYFPAAGSWMEIPLGTCFQYNNSDNLVIAIDENTSGKDTISWGSFSASGNLCLYLGSSSDISPSNPSSATGITSTVNRMQLVFPSSAVPLAPTPGFPANQDWFLSGERLTWSATPGQGDSTAYDVYFGALANPPLLSANQLDSFFQPDVSPGINYYWKVVAKNNIGDSAPTDIRSFRVPGANQLVESFEGGTFPPGDWGRTSVYWSSSTSRAKHGTKSTLNSLNSNDPLLYTPLLALTSTSTLDFWSQKTTPNGKLQIVYSANGSSWIQLGEDIAYTTADKWQNFKINLSSLAGGWYYLGFRPKSGVSSAYYVDRVIGPEIVPAQAPGMPCLISPANASSDISAFPTLIWAAPNTGGRATAYRIYLDASDGSTLFADNVTGTSHTSNISLEYGRTYYWKVAAYNARGEGAATAVWSFTPNATSDFPFEESFESGLTHNMGIFGAWNQVCGPHYETKSWVANNSNTDFNRSPKSGLWNACLEYGGQATLLRPVYLETELKYMLEYYARQDKDNMGNAWIKARLGSAPVIGWPNQEIVVQTGLANGDYQRCYGVFTVENSGVYYLGIEGWINGSSGYISLDDIKIDVVYDYPQGVSTSIVNGAGNTFGNIKIEGGAANQHEIDMEDWPAVNNAQYTSSFQMGLKLFGQGPWTLTFSDTDACWGAYYQNGAWHAAEKNNNQIVLEIGAEHKGGMVIPVTLGDINPTLPLMLSSYTATINARNQVQLTWVTQTETGVLGFYVYRNRSGELANAVRISRLIEATNTSQTQVYVYVDQEVTDEGIYYYWLQSADIDGSSVYYGPLLVEYNACQTGPNSPLLPIVTQLKDVYPNPFNPNTRIRYELAKAALVEIRIYNTRGQLIKSFALGTQEAGFHHVDWNGNNDRDQALGSGIYLIRMQAGQKIYDKKAILLK